MNKGGKKIMASGMALLIALVMLVSATVAWMTISTNPEITGLTVTLGAPERILLATKNDPTEFRETIDISADFDGFADLTPVSTIDGLHWFIPTYEDATGFPNSDVNLFIRDDKLEYANQILYEVDADGHIVTDEDGNPVRLDGLELLEAEQKGYYVYTDFWIKSEIDGPTEVRLSVPHYGADVASGELDNHFGTYALGRFDAKDINNDGELELVDISNRAQNALRCGFLLYPDATYDVETNKTTMGNPGEFYIYEPNADARSDGGKPSENGGYVVDYKLDTEYKNDWYIKTSPIGIEYNADGTPKMYKKTVVELVDDLDHPIQKTDEKGNLLYEQVPEYETEKDSNGNVIYNKIDGYVKNSDGSFSKIYGNVTTNGLVSGALHLYIVQNIGTKNQTSKLAVDDKGRELFVVPANVPTAQVIKPEGIQRVSVYSRQNTYKPFGEYENKTDYCETTLPLGKEIYLKGLNDDYIQCLKDGNPLYITYCGTAKNDLFITGNVYIKTQNGGAVSYVPAKGTIYSITDIMSVMGEDYVPGNEFTTNLCLKTGTNEYVDIDGYVITEIQNPTAAQTVPADAFIAESYSFSLIEDPGVVSNIETAGSIKLYVKDGEKYLRATDLNGAPIYFTESGEAKVDDLSNPVYVIKDGHKVQVIDYYDENDQPVYKMRNDLSKPIYAKDDKGNTLYEKKEQTKEVDDNVASVQEIDPDRLIAQRAGRWKGLDDEETFLDKVKSRIGFNSLDVDFGKFLNTNKLYDSLKKSQSVFAGDTRYVLDYNQQDTASSTVIVTLQKDVPLFIRLFIWIEGQDVDCWNDIASGNFRINLEFAGYELPSDSNS